jgi:hypothetical protein
VSQFINAAKYIQATFFGLSVPAEQVLSHVCYLIVLSSQSSLHVAVGPDTREGCHYISPSKIYLD